MGKSVVSRRTAPAAKKAHVNLDRNGFEINNQSLSDQVYHYIKKLILSGEISGGEKIPEEKVAQSFGVSRTPIRQALQKLSEYGLVILKPRSHSVVVSLHRHEAKQIAYVRAQLETLAARLLAESGTKDDFDALERIATECDALIGAGKTADTFVADSYFHLEIARRTRNTHLYEIFEKIDAKIQLSRLVIRLSQKHLTTAISQHLSIINAMRDHDKELAETMMKHHILHQLNHFK